MKKILLFTLMVLISQRVFSQNQSVVPINFRSGKIYPNQNITSKTIREINKVEFKSEGLPRLMVIQFDQIPNSDTRNQLLKAGIELLDYLPDNAYTAIVSQSLKVNTLLSSKANSIFELLPEYKLDPRLIDKKFPSYAVKSEGTVDLLVHYIKGISYDAINTELVKAGFEVVNTDFKTGQLITIRANQNAILQLAEFSFVKFIQFIPSEDVPINDKSKVVSRANVLNSTSSFGRNLSGNGVVVGVGDNASPTQHIDFNQRVINHIGISGGSHGLHVMGTLGGAGIMDEQYIGYAPKSTMVTQYFSKILSYAPQYVQDYGMTITNNSYGNDVTNCDTFGEYDLISSYLDQQAYALPYLQHIFAAGNSGVQVCAPLPAGFGNVLGCYQSAKNVLTVGNISDTYQVNSNSSRGPVNDGRIKPEIVSQGTLVRSTLPVNSYGLSTGTSMATPGVSGGLALLTERFKILNGNSYPKTGLLKTLICNGATDLGNPGPDFKYGFGVMNLLRSLVMLETGSYINDSLANGAQKNYNITVPANVAELKVMLYWNDPAGNPMSAIALVNNLDLEVMDPGNQPRLPLVLSNNPVLVNDPAQELVDNFNNIEQVVIKNPLPGNYTMKVRGTNIGQNPLQAFFVAYDIVPIATTLTFPLGKERLEPNRTVKIAWDSFGDNVHSFQVQYSADNGTNWNLIGSDNLIAGTNQLSWLVPDMPSNQFLVRVIQNGTGVISTSEAFTVLGVPVLTASPDQSETYFAINWTSVPSATDYEVLLLQGKEMVSKGFTTDLNYLFSGLSKDSTYYTSVRARFNSSAGKRAIAVNRKPDNNSGAGVALAHDLMVSEITLPMRSGRKFTSTALSAAQQVKVIIKNLDLNPSSGVFTLNYAVDDNIVYSENINQVVVAGGTYEHTFPITYDFSNIGSYKVTVVLTHDNDPVLSNNSLTNNFKQLDNPLLSLPLEDGFESLAISSISKNTVGLPVGDRYDFETNNANGRLRTFVSSGIAATGNKAITLDSKQFEAGGVTNYLIGTYNFSNYDILITDLRLDFKYKNHGQSDNSENRVWIRGNDLASWIEVYNLFENQNQVDENYKIVKSIEISRILAAHSQALTSSFQVRWGQWGKNITADWDSADGYSIDDVRFYSAINDMQVIAIKNPDLGACSYGSNESIIVRVRNSAPNTLTNIPIKYSVDGLPVVTEYIASINGRTNIDYTFTTKADFSIPRSHTIQVFVDFDSDNYADNDSQSTILFHAPMVTSFPYLQTFESNDGYFHATGRNSSWAYGTPASAKINSAASGSKAWKTNLTGNYNGNELSYLYSPCFMVNGMSAPTLSFNLALELEVCDPDPCDVVMVEYSADGGNWVILGNKGEGVNWYNKSYSGVSSWSEYNYERWHVATIPLPTGVNKVQLRFVMRSDPFSNKEGIALDDIHVYDNVNGIYNGPTLASPVSQVVPTSPNWTAITSGGKLVASIKSENENLGSTDVAVFVNTDAIRNANETYYGNRSFTIKPQPTVLSDSVSVRLFVTDAEVESLRAAADCATCVSISSVKSLGLSQYTDSDRTKEDGTIVNNDQDKWKFLTNIKRVPFDIGYYFEFKVKSFSEFWFSNSILGTASPLPVRLLSFEAIKMKEEVEKIRINWSTSEENNFDHFEIEMALGDLQSKKDDFVSIAIIPKSESLDLGKYHYVYSPNYPEETYYFRLKMIDKDGSFAYSAIRAVRFETSNHYFAFPNPAVNFIEVNFNAKTNLPVNFKLTDIAGRTVAVKQIRAVSNKQKYYFELKSLNLPTGIYLLEVKSQVKTEVFKFMKQ